MGERAVTATIHNAQRIVTHNVAREPDATRTKNATLIVQHDARTEIHLLGLVHLGFHKPACGRPVIKGVLLELALARLVADRAVERMIDQQRFQHRLAHPQDPWRLGVNLHAGRNRCGAGDRSARRGRIIRQHLQHNPWRPVRVQNRLTIRAHRRQPELHEAHAAIARHRQLRDDSNSAAPSRPQLARLDHRGRQGPARDRIRHGAWHRHRLPSTLTVMVSTGGGAGWEGWVDMSGS
jgi:hypothetical protein